MDVVASLRRIAEQIEQRPELDIEVHVFAEYEEPLTKEIIKLQHQYPYLAIQPKSGRSKLILNTRYKT